MNTNSLEIDVEDVALINAECLSCKFVTTNLTSVLSRKKDIKIRFSKANLTGIK